MNCRICDASSRHLFAADKWPLEKCSNCQFVQVGLRPEREELGRIYSEGYFRREKYSDDVALDFEYKRRLKLMAQHLPKQTRVLEIGCASGDFLQRAATAYRISGIDFSAAAIERARSQHPHLSQKFESGDIGQMTLPQEAYDAVVMWDVIEHLWDPRGTMEHVWDALQPGGLLFLSTPDAGAWTARIFRKHWAFMTPPEHLGFFDKKSMEELFTRRLNGTIEHRSSRGKLVNAGFLVYKMGRKFPWLAPGWLSNILRKKPFNRIRIYVPTMDIQYVVIRKKRNNHTAP